MQETRAEPYTPSEPDVMEISGRFDGGTAAGVQEDALLCIESGARRMVLDCRDLTYISGAGLRAMLALARAMQATGGRLAVSGLQPQVEEMFEAGGLDAVISVYDNPDKAIAALAG